jgi:hypothetical protein
MRKETSQVLAAMAAKYPKRTLLALWSDLRKLSKNEFETLLDSARQPATTRTRALRLTEPAVPNDTPTSRIEHLLLTQAAMGQSQAADEITAQLLREGIAASRIPSLRGRPFADWLSVLFRSVPAARVMHAALQISARSPQRD